jgi:hypothetical protein
MTPSGMYKRVRWKPSSNTLEPDRSQHDRPAACVNDQQYSSATPFHSRKETIGAHSKNVIIRI